MEGPVKGQDATLEDHIAQVTIDQPNFLTQIYTGGTQDEVNQIPSYEEYSALPMNQEVPTHLNQDQCPPPAPAVYQQYPQPTANLQFQAQYTQPAPNQKFQPYLQQSVQQNHGFQQRPQPTPNQGFMHQYAQTAFNQPYGINKPNLPPSTVNQFNQQNLQSPVNPPYPYSSPQVAPGQGAWSAHLFDCFDDVPLWCITLWCPCVAFGQISEIVDQGTSACSTSGAIYGLIFGLTGCQSAYSCTYRTKMRHQYGIPGDDFEDYCTHLWCESCALLQEHKHLRALGYNVPLGWHGNMNMARQREAQGVPMAPVPPNGMVR